MSVMMALSAASLGELGQVVGRDEGEVVGSELGLVIGSDEGAVVGNELGLVVGLHLSGIS